MKISKLLIINVIFFLISNIVARAETITNYKREDGLVSENVTAAIHMDPSGNIWVGTEQGISRYDGLTWRSYRTSNANLPSEFINCIMSDNLGNLYFGTSSGVSLFDSPKWETLIIGLPKNDVESMIMDNYEDIWFGTSGGLAKYRNLKVTDTYTESNSEIADEFVKQIAIDSFDYFWLATGNGVSRFDNHNFVNYTTINNLPSNTINSIAVEQVESATEDNGDIIWVATPNGVGKKSGDFWSIIYPSTDGLLDRDVKCVAVDYQNNKWFATDYGMSVLTNTQSWVNYTEADGLVSNHCSNVAVDNSNNIWIGATEGVSKIGNNAIVSFNEILYLNIETLAYVTVQDSKVNIDPNVKETVTVTVGSTTDADGITLTLKETAENSGIFSSNSPGDELGFSYIGSDEGNRLLYVSKGDSINAYYNESNSETIRIATAYYNEEAPFKDTLFLACFVATASYEENKSNSFIGTLLSDFFKLVSVLHN